MLRLLFYFCYMSVSTSTTNVYIARVVLSIIISFFVHEWVGTPLMRLFNELYVGFWQSYILTVLLLSLSLIWMSLYFLIHVISALVGGYVSFSPLRLEVSSVSLVAIIIMLNVIALYTFKIDKERSKAAGKSRISESFLFFQAYFFGAVGSYLGMKLFKHKTRKKVFQQRIPLFICINVIFAFVFFLLTYNTVDYLAS